MVEAHNTRYFYAPEEYKDVSQFEGQILVEQYEERNSSFRVPMHDMSVGEGRTSKATRSFASIGDSAVEMGTSHHGFHLRLTNH